MEPKISLAHIVLYEVSEYVQFAKGLSELNRVKTTDLQLHFCSFKVAPRVERSPMARQSIVQ